MEETNHFFQIERSRVASLEADKEFETIAMENTQLVKQLLEEGNAHQIPQSAYGLTWQTLVRRNEHLAMRQTTQARRIANGIEHEIGRVLEISGLDPAKSLTAFRCFIAMAYGTPLVDTQIAETQVSEKVETMRKEISQMMPTLKRLAQTLRVNSNIKPPLGETDNSKEKTRKKKSKQEVTRKGGGGQPEEPTDDDRGEKLTNEVRHTLTRCISILAEAQETTEFTLAHIPVIASEILGTTSAIPGGQQISGEPKPQMDQEKDQEELINKQIEHIKKLQDQLSKESKFRLEQMRPIASTRGHQEEIEELQKEKEAASEKCNKFKEQIEDKEHELQKMHNKFRKSRMQIEDKEHELQETQTRLDILKQQIRAHTSTWAFKGGLHIIHRTQGAMSGEAIAQIHLLKFEIRKHGELVAWSSTKAGLEEVVQELQEELNRRGAVAGDIHDAAEWHDEEVAYMERARERAVVAFEEHNTTVETTQRMQQKAQGLRIGQQVLLAHREGNIDGRVTDITSKRVEVDGFSFRHADIEELTLADGREQPQINKSNETDVLSREIHLSDRAKRLGDEMSL